MNALADAPAGNAPDQELFIHRLVEAQVARSPDAIALADADGRMTYAQMNLLANRLARRLRLLGAGPETRVGVLMGRSCALVVTLLGILKTGASYVPLDPDYPVARLRFMLEDTQAGLMVTTRDIQQATRLAFDGTVVDFAQATADLAADDESNPRVRQIGDHLAYVTYTSGSTGRPKAVGVRHAGAARYVASALSTFERADLAGVLFGASVCFDLSIFEMFVPLAAGGCVIVAKNLLDLPAVSEREEVTLISAVPPVMAELLRQSGIPPSVRVVNLGGEAVTAALARQVRERSGAVRMFNLYGPSECTTYSTIARIAPDEAEIIVPIGTAIAGTACYVLDDALEAVPAGEEGELHIGGDGVARGYLNRPALTAERFLPDPHPGRTGQRMYRTGDRVRQRADGQLVYIGRYDFQVKLRGYRIELGEIESVIEEDPAVGKAVVLLHGEGGEDQRLVAYVTMKTSGARIDRASQHARLTHRLPDYMLPACWVDLEHFPITLNGKVDRKVLAASIPPEPVRTLQGAMPQTETQEQLAAMWSELLGLEGIGLEDNFFALGGHSLMASRMLSRIERERHVELPLKSLFHAPTLGGFAREVDARMQTCPGTSQRIRRLGAQHAPLSYPQEMLYLEDQLHASATCYNVVQSFRIAGDLDVHALEWALAELVRRHEALRTRFVREGEEILQRIDPPRNASPLVIKDMTDLPDEQERTEQTRRALLQSARGHFSIGSGTLMRAIVVRHARSDYRLAITVHHIATDGWGQGVLRRELGALYRSFGQPSPLPELAVQYADYAQWQRGWLDESRLQSGLEYWGRQLHGTPASTGFVADRPRPANRTYRGAREPVVLDAGLTRQLRQLCKRCEVTPFMLLLAAIDVLLYRTTGIDDIVVGTAFSDRRQIETEGLVGDFVNTVMLRGNLAGSPSVRELLRAVAQTTVDAHQHRDIPFQKLVEHFFGDRSLQRNPFFQVMLVLQNAPNDLLDFGDGLTATEEPIDIGTSQLDFALSLTEDGDRFVGHVEYCVDLYDGETIRSLIASYATLLAAMVADPDRGIDDLELVSQAECRRLVALGAGTEDHADQMLACARFERCVERDPDAIAVVTEEGRTTYGALNEKACRLARRMIALGVGPEVRVGVMLKRSEDLYVALLGILKAGGTYVPMDPTYPAERLAFMAADAGLTAILVDGHDLAPAPQGAWTIVDMAASVVEPDRPPVARPAIALSPDNLAYVFYTSGTTGRPKGVGVSHGALANQLAWVTAAFALAPADRFLQKASICFDSSIEEILAPLVSGGRIVAARPGGEYDVEYLADLVAREAVTCIDLAPSLLQALMEAAEPRALRSVRLVASGGDVLKPEVVRTFNAHFQATLFNTYGPTETTVQATWTSNLDGEGNIPIGRPVARTQLYVLDARLAPVPAGTPGELYIGGMGVARGYVNRPALTAEKFMPDLFGGAGGRLYRTGDQVRWRAGGQLEFLGRLDHQIKLRGYRIEPAEIERAIESDARVEQAVVVVREDRPGEPQLVAYVVTTEEIASTDWRNSLRDRLPHYMLPSQWVSLPVFPLDANGKIDRKRLPRPGHDVAPASHVAPRSATEEAICSIFEDLLQRAPIGVDDSFFDLGGHSLSAMRAAGRLSAHFAVDLPVRALFEAPTAARLAVDIQQRLAEKARPSDAERSAMGNARSTDQMMESLDALSEDEVELMLAMLGKDAA